MPPGIIRDTSRCQYKKDKEKTSRGEHASRKKNHTSSDENRMKNAVTPSGVDRKKFDENLSGEKPEEIFI
jgi:hypothetical protein